MNLRPLLLTLLLLSPVAQASEALKVIDCMRNNLPPALRAQDVELETVRGTTTLDRLSGELFTQREEQGLQHRISHAMLRVNKPDSLRGAAFLLRQTDDFQRDGMFVFMPAIKRVRKVTGTFAGGALLGTSFSYFDFKQLRGAFGDFQPLRMDGEKLDGRDTFRLDFRAEPARDLPYTGVRTWIDQASCLPLRAEFMEGDTVLKRFVTAPNALREQDGYWYASVATLDDYAQNLRTTLRVSNLRTQDHAPEIYFDPERFHRAP